MDKVRFPILRSAHTSEQSDVPWGLVAPHEAQARRNHSGQDLEMLARRGGLSWAELHAVLHDKPFQSMNPMLARECVLSELAIQYRALVDEVTYWREDAAARLQTALTMARAYDRDGKADLAAIYTVAIILPTRAALASALAGEIYYPLCEGCSKPIEAGDVVFAIGDGDGQTGELHAFCDRPKLDGHGGEVEAPPEGAYLFVPDDSFSPDKIAGILADANAYLGDRG